MSATVGDRLRGDLDCAAAVRGARHADPRAPPCAKLPGFLFYRLAEEDREGNPTALRLGLERAEGRVWRADGGPSKLRHDA
jgi:hypothetical protein